MKDVSGTSLDMRTGFESEPAWQVQLQETFVRLTTPMLGILVLVYLKPVVSHLEATMTDTCLHSLGILVCKELVPS